MKYIFPCLTTLALAVAADAAPAQNSGPPSVVSRPSSADHGPRTTDHGQLSVGDRLLLQAAAQLERRDSVAARMRYAVHLNDHDLRGIGNYWQQGRGDTLRVRLELQMTDQESSLLQVSNSRFLWTDLRLPTGRNVSRIDLRQLRADPLLAASGTEEIQPGQASWSPIQPELTASCGGLPTLLVSLQENLAFLPPQAMRLNFDPPLVPKRISLPVFAVVGHWKPERLAALLGEHDAWPPRVPREVLLLVGQADLFPYRVEYLHELGDSKGPYQLSAEPMVVLELSDVAFDAPIAASQFDYAPGETEWNDRTAEHLQSIRKKYAERVARGESERR